MEPLNLENLFVSLIIPARNEEAFIGKCLDSLVNNIFPKSQMEIAIVDGMSKDGTRNIVKDYMKRFPFIKLLDNPKKIIPAAMNIGIKNTRGGIVMKIDAHAVYSTNYISLCVDHLLRYKVDNVGGVIVTSPREKTLMGYAIAHTISSLLGVGKSSFRLGCRQPIYADAVFSGCYKREVLEKVGFFDENIARSEDIALNSKIRRNNGKILLVPEIISYYFARSSFGSFLRHNFDNGFWITYPLKFRYLLFSYRHLIPLVFVSSLVVLFLLSFHFKSFYFILLFLISIYLVVSCYFSSMVAFKEKDIRYFFLMPVLYLSLHLSYGLGSLFGLVNTVMNLRGLCSLKNRS